MRFIKSKNSIISLQIATLVLALTGFTNAYAGVTGLTFVISSFDGGGLAISVPGPASFPTIMSPETDTSVSVTLETVTVTDSRRSTSGTATWTTTAQASDLLSGSETLTANTFRYRSGGHTKIGGAVVVTSNDANTLSGPQMVEASSGITGNHVVSWFPTVFIPVPGNKPAGTYQGTITHSVS